MSREGQTSEPVNWITGAIVRLDPVIRQRARRPLR